MNLSEGAPWWLTIVLTFSGAGVAHFLTAYRDRARESGDWIERWRAEAKSLIKEIANAATSHYLDQDAVGRTGISAALIINDLKRLQGCLRETECENSSDTKRTVDALRHFTDTITGPDDFQDELRSMRPGGSEIFRMIRDAEAELLESVRISRRRRE